MVSEESRRTTVSTGRLLEGLLRWRWFPEALQLPLLAAGLVALLLAPRTPRHSEMNVGAALIWQLWWPLLPFLLLPLARMWCALCPFATLQQLIQRLRPRTLPPPPSRLRRLGPWIATLGLALLGFLFLLLSLEASGQSTAGLLVAFALGAAATATLWDGRGWCRYLCPIGLMLGLYSRLAWLRLEPLGEKGRKVAAAGARSCPTFTSPVAPRRSHDCVVCAGCLRVPGGEAVAVRTGRPALMEHPLARPEAVAVSLLMGLLLADALRMTPAYLRYMAWAVPRLHGSYEAAMALGIVAVMSALLAAQTALAFRSSGRRAFWSRFACLSMAILPLALATQLALSTQHLLVAGEVIRNVAAEVGIAAPGHMPPEDAYGTLWSVKGLQWAMLAAGVAASAYLMGRRQPSLMSACVGVALLAIFAMPMSVTC